MVQVRILPCSQIIHLKIKAMYKATVRIRRAYEKKYDPSNANTYDDYSSVEASRSLAVEYIKYSVSDLLSLGACIVDTFIEKVKPTLN